MNVIGNLALSLPLAHHLQVRLNQDPQTIINTRGLVADNPTQKRVVIRTDLAGWFHVSQLIRDYDKT